MQRPKRFKIARRLGPAVFEQTQTERFALSTARKEKNARQSKHRRNLSAYNLALREKQRVRFYYGIPERQMQKYIDAAMGGAGSPLEGFFVQLETRLDNIAHRIGLAPTHRAARQMVAHGHLTVNGKRMRVPSHQVSIGDVIAVRGGSSGKTLFVVNLEKQKEQKLPAWIKEAKGGWEITGHPSAEEIPSAFNFGAVMEFYSR